MVEFDDEYDTDEAQSENTDEFEIEAQLRQEPY